MTDRLQLNPGLHSLIVDTSGRIQENDGRKSQVLPTECQILAGALKDQVDQVAVIEGVTGQGGFNTGDESTYLNGVIFQNNGNWGGIFLTEKSKPTILVAESPEKLHELIAGDQGGFWPRGSRWSELMTKAQSVNGNVPYIRFRGQDEYASSLSVINIDNDLNS